MFTNDDVKRWCVYLNPFLRRLIPPDEYELWVMPAMKLRERAILAPPRVRRAITHGEMPEEQNGQGEVVSV